MTGLVDIETAMRKFLNESLGTAITTRGDSIPVPWYDEGGEYPKTVTPYGTFLFNGQAGDIFVDKSAPLAPVALEDTDVIAFAAGTSIYPVEEKDIVSITSITGTLGGTPGHVFVEDVDYETVSEDEYTTLTAINWISGGDSPDDATQFTVVYDHRAYNQIVRTFVYHDYRLMVHADKQTVGANHYPKMMVAREVANYFHALLESVRGSEIASGVKLHDSSVTQVPSFTGGEAFASQLINLRVGVTTDFVASQVGAVGKAVAIEQFPAEVGQFTLEP